MKKPNILNKLKQFFVNKVGLSSDIKSIMKNKKLTKFEKINSIFQNSKEYFCHKMIKNVKFATWEIYYEFFTKNGKHDETLYQKAFKYELENEKCCDINDIAKAIDKLYTYNDNYDELSNQSLNLCKYLKNFNGFMNDFRPELFYFPESEYRKDAMNVVNFIFDSFTNLKSEENDCQENVML